MLPEKTAIATARALSALGMAFGIAGLSSVALAAGSVDSSAVLADDVAVVSPVRLAQAGGFPTLTSESTGESVRQLQGMLRLLGFYTGEIDGVYSAATQTAVSQFQSAAGIAVDGITGPSTWQKLLPQPAEVQAVAARPAPVAAPPAPENNATAEPAEPITPPGPPILRPGAEGPAVAQLQRELQELGFYEGDIDGGYGELTQAAVESFQREQQITVDAIVGPSTWDALSRALDL